jgi:hypothetical protein
MKFRGVHLKNLDPIPWVFRLAGELVESEFNWSAEIVVDARAKESRRARIELGRVGVAGRWRHAGVLWENGAWWHFFTEDDGNDHEWDPVQKIPVLWKWLEPRGLYFLVWYKSRVTTLKIEFDPFYQ